MIERKSYSTNEFRLELPDLLEMQKASYERFLQAGISAKDRRNEGLERVFRDTFQDVSDAKKLLVLRYSHYNLAMPRYSIKECRERGVTYSRQLIVHLELQTFKEDGEEKKLQDQVANDVFFCDLPVMTDNGTFIINGAERVVISQLHRSPGVSFDSEQLPSGKVIFQSRIIPNRGSWLEFNTENDVLYMLIDRKKKLPATVLLRAVGYETNAQILALFHTGETLEIKTGEEHANRALFKDAVSEDGEIIVHANSILDIDTCQKLLDAGINSVEVVKENLDEYNLIHNTLANDDIEDPKKEKDDDKARKSYREIAHERIYQTTRSQPAADSKAAREHFENLFFERKRYEIGELGRYRLNSKVHKPDEQPKLREFMTLTKEDFVSVIGYMIGLYNGEEGFSLDDIDHLGNRRVRSVGELVANQISVGISRILRSVRENFSSRDREGVLTPTELINSRTVNSMVAAFFGSSQLSQFMDQINPLSELTNKRRISALGPGGLSRDRAGLEVRDVHHSHYGRLCPIETPEGANIGLINSLATFSTVNRFGFIETPYRIVGLLKFKGADGKDYEFPESKWHAGIMKNFFGDANQQLLTQTEVSKNEIKIARRKFCDKQLEFFDLFCNKSFEFDFGNECEIIQNGVLVGRYAKNDSKKPKADFVQQSSVVQMVVSEWIVYLTAYEEDQYRIAPASTILDTKTKRFVDEFVLVRAEGEFPSLPNPEEISVEDVETQRVDLMDVSPMQIVSVAAGLIPFLEHDDANRALMGSNMQRQAVPLLRAEAPIVGTGLEKKVALDSGTLVRAKNDGVVTFVDATRIEILREKGHENYETLGLPPHDIYELRKFERSNQDSCINQKPICKAGDKIKAGDVLADGASTDKGELALGKNIRIAFLPWQGYNYEDAIIISEELAIKDTFTSIHIEEYEIEVRETKRGKEEITRDVPNVSEKDRHHLGEDGIVRIGMEVRPGDILVGKVTPKGESELTPEEKLLRAIFGSKSGDVSDSSLRIPSGVKGIVVDTQVFQRRDSRSSTKEEEQRHREELAGKIRAIAKEYDEKVKAIEESRRPELSRLLLDKTSGNVRNGITNEVIISADKKWTKELLDKTDFSQLASGSVFCTDSAIQEEVSSLLGITNRRIAELNDLKEKEIDKVNKGDELKPGVFKVVKVYIAKKRRLSIGDKMAGRHGNKGVVAKIVSVEDMPFTEDGKPVQILLNPLGVPSRMNVGQVLEVHLGWAAATLGMQVETPVFNGVSFSSIEDELKKAYIKNPIVKISENSWTEDEKKEFKNKHGKDIPSEGITGKATLYDGRTGEPFLNDVTIGTMYMLKLNHLVEDKIHARSTGPYALVTQQPLGGKSHFGGQRFGEMEVWALEAYGAAYTLQELLTVKSDDIIGRNKIYDAIVKGENPPAPGTPESFRVLVREFRSLGLDIKVSEVDNA
ncbi:MAG: DNA-directed RNA polymerase subunit beta [Fibromonadaceae bacterium]|jgi:DNA-directed RNA polymerase subunit beta|nr:DNA-directed RNA polymerase subunit beta [Fibromonadaceae bacterium]